MLVQYRHQGLNTLGKPRFGDTFSMQDSAGAKKLLKEKFRLPVDEIFQQFRNPQFRTAEPIHFSYVFQQRLLSGTLQACTERGQPLLRLVLANNGQVSFMLNKTQPQYGQHIKSVFAETSNANNRQALILLSKIGFDIGQVRYSPQDISNALARFPLAS